MFEKKWLFLVSILGIAIGIFSKNFPEEPKLGAYIYSVGMGSSTLLMSERLDVQSIKLRTTYGTTTIDYIKVDKDGVTHYQKVQSDNDTIRSQIRNKDSEREKLRENMLK